MAAGHGYSAEEREHRQVRAAAILDLFWNQDIPTKEIASQFQITPSSVSKIAHGHKHRDIFKRFRERSR